MRIVCLSDTHGLSVLGDLSIPAGDVLVHAGDGTNVGAAEDVRGWLEWVAAQPHPYKVVIAGNHDRLFDTDPAAALSMVPAGVFYLQDSGCVINGVRFWGSPWQPSWPSWAFFLPRSGPRIRERWNSIPFDTEVLVTHTPPYGVLDLVDGDEGRLGCEELSLRVASVRPRLHVFGHVHQGHGVLKRNGVLSVNASILNEHYRIGHAPVVVDLDVRGARRVLKNF